MRFFLAAYILFALPPVVRAASFYVSPDGSDTSPGTREKPFATPVRARDAARASKETSREIIFLPGDYCLSKPLTLDVRDSGLTVRAEKSGTARLLGGRILTGWHREGDRFWTVDLPEVKAGDWDFRALEVDGRLAPRACWPDQTNRLDNLGKWNVRLLPALAGWWERKPTHAELTEMPYRPGDLPPGLDTKNAEIRLYHMWSESLCGVASNDVTTCRLILSSPAGWPMGACGRRQYVVYNIREGMTAPGQWYLDRTAGKVVYWPHEGQDMTKLRVVAPRLQTILMVIGGEKDGKVRNVTLDGLSLSVTTPPLRKASFGGDGLPAAFFVKNAADIHVSHLLIRNVGGMGCTFDAVESSTLTDSTIAFTGARGLAVRGKNITVARNAIHDVGLLFPSSSAVGAYGTRMIFCQNEIRDVPYSGVIIGGSGHLFEGNLISRVMRVLHDGAAVYGNISDCVIRGNIVRDVVPNGKGFGASAFYVDEGGHDVLVEGNFTEGVPMPVHNHITRQIVVRGNTFVSAGDLTISFQNSVACTFDENVVFVGGRFNMRSPNAMRSWVSNRVFKAAKPGFSEAGFLIGNAAPDNPQLPPRTESVPVLPLLHGVPPVFDGEVASDEWPGIWSAIDRDATRRKIGGAPAMVRVASDGTNLFCLVSVTSFRSTPLTSGRIWGVDDAVQINFGEKWIRGFIDGTVTASTPELRHCIRRSYAGPAQKNRGMGKLQYYAFELPLSAVWKGTPSKDAKCPFNVSVFSSAYHEFRYWESGQSGTLRFTSL